MKFLQNILRRVTHWQITSFLSEIKRLVLFQTNWLFSFTIRNSNHLLYCNVIRIKIGAFLVEKEYETKPKYSVKLVVVCCMVTALLSAFEGGKFLKFKPLYDYSIFSLLFAAKWAIDVSLFVRVLLFNRLTFSFRNCNLMRVSSQNNSVNIRCMWSASDREQRGYAESARC